MAATLVGLTPMVVSAMTKMVKKMMKRKVLPRKAATVSSTRAFCSAVCAQDAARWENHQPKAMRVRARMTLMATSEAPAKKASANLLGFLRLTVVPLGSSSCWGRSSGRVGILSWRVGRRGSAIE